MLGHALLWKFGCVAADRARDTKRSGTTWDKRHSPAALASFERRCGDGLHKPRYRFAPVLKFDRRGR